ncbi:CoA transferase [Nakamurella sp. YIM 132087]|uniref:CoA transferase n=1 Tax=Nakamurella alba TaxID=2665158 RepID=A0A7K1FEA6_9ACTN|nr:CoA transferase [Nakamurella alba]MTD12416.1 CoA transferase [Nakamurella alba]
MTSTNPVVPDPAPGTGALTGIRVLDFTRFMQGPYATRILADLGADVIKVERPGGEWDRRLRVSPRGFAGFFHVLNRGKRSLAIDITTPRGRELVLEVARDCDVVVENFRAGVMDRLGLGYDDIRAVNPRVVFAAGSGHGPNGPNAADPMYDMVAQAMSGVSDFNRAPDGTPRLATRGLADVAGGMFLAMGVLSALVARERTGVGQRVDASLVGASIALHPAEVTIALEADHVFRLGGTRVTSTSGAFRARDGKWLVIGATDQKLWFGLAEALGLRQLSDDERFSRSRIREANRDQLEPIIEQAFLTRDRDEWIGVLQAHRVPAAPVNSFLDLPDDPDVRANGYIVEQDDRQAGPIRLVGPAFHLQHTPLRVGTFTPELGEHSAEVLSQAGLADDDLATLAELGIVEIGAPPEPLVGSSAAVPEPVA